MRNTGGQIGRGRGEYPNPRLDEVPVAFVELRSGSALRAQELIEFCKGQIASYKIPRAIYFIEANEWPMSATKVDKQALRSRLTHTNTNKIELFLAGVSPRSIECGGRSL